MTNAVRSGPARRAVTACVILMFAVLAACQPAAAQPPRSSTITQRDYPTPARPLNLAGQVVFSPGDGSLWLQNASGGNTRPLAKRNEDHYAEMPAFSPDGKQVAYAAKSYTQQGEMIEDIRVVNVDGTNERVIASPPDTKTALSFPAWSPDGQQIWLTRSLITPGAEHDEIDRVALSGGTPRMVLDNARNVNLSPDGKRMVFLRFDYKTLRSSLWVASADGSNPKMIMDDRAFAAIEGPRFSPDSTTIAFAASGAPQETLPGLQSLGPGGEQAQAPLAAADSCAVRLLFTCWVGSASAHGLPWDLWLVNLNGTKYERLTQVGADSPYPVWSPDGTHVAFMDFSGIYVVERQSKTGYLVSMNGGHGALDWH